MPPPYVPVPVQPTTNQQPSWLLLTKKGYDQGPAGGGRGGVGHVRDMELHVHLHNLHIALRHLPFAICPSFQFVARAPPRSTAVRQYLPLVLLLRRARWHLPYPTPCTLHTPHPQPATPLPHLALPLAPAPCSCSCSFLLLVTCCGGALPPPLPSLRGGAGVPVPNQASIPALHTPHIHQAADNW
jgi:hypothetical protein